MFILYSLSVVILLSLSVVTLQSSASFDEFQKAFGNMSGKSISIGLGARNLRDRDFFGVSDPYVVISRPNPSGGFSKIRTSETKMNTLNPNWNDFLFTESELNGYDKDLKLM